MKKLNITKEQFNRSNYFQMKYGKLKYVSESGKLFKTNKGKVLKFNEGFMSNMGKDGQHLYSIIYKFDDWDGSVQEYGKTEEDAIQNAIAKGKIDDEDEIVKIVDLGERGDYLESGRKLVKEGAGAGYTVHIKDLKFGSIIDKKYVKMKEDYDSYWECQVEILPGEYEIEAEDYYNDFFWQEHEFGERAFAKIDGGVATISYSTNSYDEDEAEDELRHEVARRKMDIAFGYGWGWVHADLPKDKPIESDHVDVEGTEFYGSIDKIELNAPDLADAVNCGFQSIYDRDEEEEEEEEEPINESFGDEDGWRVFDYGEDFPYTERYTVLDTDGYLFFISHNGGVGSYTCHPVNGDSDDVLDELTVTLRDKSYTPVQLGDKEISENRIIQKGLKLIKAKYDYDDQD